MNIKLPGRIFSVTLLAGLPMFSPLMVEALDAEGKADSGASLALETRIREALREHKSVKFEVLGEDVILQGYCPYPE